MTNLKIIRRKAVAFFVLTSLITAFTLIQNVYAQTTIGVDPPEVIVPLCTNFEVNVKVTDVLNLYQVEFWLGYNTALLDALNAMVLPPFTPLAIDIDDPSGYVHIAAIAVPPLFGDGIVATVAFHCTGAGKSVLDLYDTYLVDPSGMSISHGIIDGSVTQTAFYWKPPQTDYAPSGLPDFDQRQNNWKNPQTNKWSYCGPTALANSFWWLDSFYEPGNVAPPTISDGFGLVKSYNASVDDHDPGNVPLLIEDLAWYLDTDGIRTGIAHNGTYIDDIEAGINWWLVTHCLDNVLGVKKVFEPTFEYVEYEVERCEDVILLLGFYHYNISAPPEKSCWRIGGHYVTVAGVCSANKTIAFSDPRVDYAEPPPHGNGWPGQVLPPTPPPHPHPANPPDTLHNNATYVSHDQYGYADTTMYPCVDGIWGPAQYENWTIIEDFVGQNGDIEGSPAPGQPGIILVTTVEYAMVVSPTNWYWKSHYADYAPSGVPDFYQYQSSWTKYCGPTAVANSLWWFDSKFEPNNASPPSISDGFRLLQSYNAGVWDDHDPRNVQPFIDELAWYMDTNGMHSGTQHNGTEVHGMEKGIDWYLGNKSLSNTFYEGTLYNPPFYEVEEEVKKSEDVILLIVFFEVTPEYDCWPIGAHFVTVAGVNSEDLMIAFSDPGIDNAEPSPHGNNGTGRVIPPPPHGHLADGTIHNNATYVSHDIYNVSLNIALPCHPGVYWGPINYATNCTAFAQQYEGQNIPIELQPQYQPYLPIPGSRIMPIVTHAVIVSPRPGIVAAGSTNRKLFAFDFDGKQLWNFTAGGEIVSIAMSVDGQHIVVGSKEDALFLFHSNGTQLWNRTIPVADGAWGVGRESKSVGISADGNYIVAATTNGLVLYRNNGTLIWNYTGYFKCVTISADGNYVAALDSAGRIQLFSSFYDGVSGWSGSDGTPLWSKPSISMPAWLAMDAIGQYLVACNSTNVFLMDTLSNVIWNHVLNRGGIVRCDISWDGRSVVVVNDDGTNQIGAELVYFNDTNDGIPGWNSTDGTPVWRFAPSPDLPTNDLYTVDISKYSDIIATGGAPTNVYLLTTNGNLQQNLTEPNTVMAVDLTFTGQYGAVGDVLYPAGPGQVYFFSKDKGTTLWNFTIGGTVRSVAISEIYPSMFPFPDHDVAVTNVTPDRVSVTPGSIVSVNVTVTNEGDFDERVRVECIVIINDTDGKWYFPDPDIPEDWPLSPPKKSITIPFTWNTTGASEGKYTFIAKVSLVQDEIDIYDNTFLNGTVYVAIPIGGVDIPVDKFALLVPYIGLASTIVGAIAITAIYVKRVKHRKKKQ